MRIVHYTDTVRDILHSGYKPAGFLHCAVVEYATSRDDLPLLGYVIYVWDTREVVASGKARIKGATHGHAESAVGKTAKDSHEQLKGSGDVVKDVNSVMTKAGTEARRYDKPETEPGENNCLYMTDEPDKCTFDFSKIKDPMKTFSPVTLSYDPHGGFYFEGKTSALVQLQHAMSAKTNFTNY
jgi:hypothetical protein